MIKRTNRRMTLCITLLCLNLLFIWGNSLVPGTISGAFSQWVKDLINAFFPAAFPDAQGGGGLLRKLAHFSEFSLLGLCLGWLFGMLRGKRKEQITFSIFLGFLAACVDETIQRFVPGRNCSLTDVGIDTVGVITGIVLLTIGYYILRKKQQYLEETS